VPVSVRSSRRRRRSRVTLDLHQPQIQGFFRIPVDDLYALPVLCKRSSQRAARPHRCLPDTGLSSGAGKYGRFWRAIAIAIKQRKGHDERAQVLEIIGEVQEEDACR